MIVDDNVSNFNKNRDHHYHTSYYICVYESMSRWCGIRKNKIKFDFPHYIDIDRKPENGCDIQIADDGVSSISIQLKLFKT